MDTDTLVKERIDDAAKLVKELPQEGFEVMAALWLKSTENDRWRFYIVSPIAETEALPQAYGRLHTLIRQRPQPFAIDPLEVRLIGPTDPIARDVLDILQRVRGPQVGPIRWSGIRLGNLSIDGAYLYPLPAPAATH
jgi:hypothetical protein